MKLTNILKNKRGVAIETALVFLLSIFAMCALLTGLALVGHSQVQVEKKSLSSTVELQQIGEDYLNWAKIVNPNPEDFSTGSTKYVCRVSEDREILKVWHKDSTESNVLLYVQVEITAVEGSPNQVDLIRWCNEMPTS